MTAQDFPVMASWYGDESWTPNSQSELFPFSGDGIDF